MIEKRWYTLEDGIERLKRLISYDPTTGKLFWKTRSVDLFQSERIMRSWNAKYAGKEALTAKGSHGHCYGSIFNEDVSAHRVAWALHYGVWPDDEIDHIDRNPSNNRADNLRISTRRQNCWNQGKLRNRTSRFIGVSWDSSREKWKAEINNSGKKTYIGRFDLEEDAARAYDEQAFKHRGEFASCNFSMVA